MAGSLTLSEARQALNITGTDDDAELLRMLKSATELVESIVGPLASRTVVERHDRVDDVLCLREPPVLSVTTIAARIGGATLYSTADVDVDAETGIVRHAFGARLGCTYGGVIVTYTAGRESVPESVRQATAIILDQLWQTQRGWAGAGPDARGEFDSPAQVPMGFALPHRAEQLLEPYRQLGFA